MKQNDENDVSNKYNASKEINIYNINKFNLDAANAFWDNFNFELYTKIKLLKTLKNIII